MTTSGSGVVLAAAMVVSSTVIYLAFSNQKNQRSPPNQILRSCLSSEEKKQGRRKKRVHFAENVKDTKGNGEEYRRKHDRKSAATLTQRSCRSDMPGNRMVLYNGILRERGRRMQSSY